MEQREWVRKAIFLPCRWILIFFCVAAEEDTRLAAYWDSSHCGPHGSNYQWSWCEKTRFLCAPKVSTTHCESGFAKLVSTRGTGECCESVLIDGCSYAYYAQYECDQTCFQKNTKVQIVAQSRYADQSGACANLMVNICKDGGPNIVKFNDGFLGSFEFQDLQPCESGKLLYTQEDLDAEEALGRTISDDGHWSCDTLLDWKGITVCTEPSMQHYDWAQKCPAHCAKLSKGLVESGGTKDRCDESQWPDVKDRLVCSDCKVVVDKVKSKYKSCNGYCHNLGMHCKSGWKAVEGTCRAEDAMSCAAELDSTSAICECEPRRSQCDTSRWPDVKNGVVCGDCTVLVDKFYEKYKNCDAYCSSVGMDCANAWDATGDTCSIAHAMPCNQRSTSDTLCECKPKSALMCTDISGGAGEDQQRCENANSLDDGFEYVYKRGRGSDSIACQSVGCVCCRRAKSYRGFMAVGQGQCHGGIMRRNVGINDASSCLSLCEAEQDCEYVSYNATADRSCSRYGALDCSLFQLTPSETVTTRHKIGSCDESKWPDVKDGVVCGDCRVLVDKLQQKYGNCNGYCNFIGLSCAGAWEDTGDTCTMKHSMPCERMGFSNTVCECTPKADHCDESQWPDVKDGIVCGDCKVLVDEFEKYENCDGYCRSIGLDCFRGWRQDGTSCQVDNPISCFETSESATLCQCKPSAPGTITPVGMVDLAFHKSASASSVGHHGDAFKITDGKSNGGVYQDKSQGVCAHTLGGTGWIKIDLEQPQAIGAVSLVGRSDCCHDQSNGLTIRIGDTGTIADMLCSENVNAGGRVIQVRCGQNPSGRYITVWKDGVIVLCELEAYAAMSQVSTQPSPGSPESCKCEEVTMHGLWSPGALVKCTNCKDIHRSLDSSSCPAGTKLFSPRTRADWATFFRSTSGGLRDPNWIVDITRPEGGCGGCADNAMNSGNSQQKSWTTSDGSPWWLRSTPYTDPSADYHANCFLELGHFDFESGEEVRFNDANCNYHSKSYYCQPKLELSTVPAPGSPSSCKCERVTMNGPWSPGALVKCTDCKDVSRSLESNSCPVGTKLFSPRSEEDWSAFFASTGGALRDPHWIIDITRPESGCGSCTHNAMNSDDPDQRSWVTSDGSPWWMRSSPYSEPTYDYDANCFLDLHADDFQLGHRIKFKSDHCNYHSRSYYCQPSAGRGGFKMSKKFKVEGSAMMDTLQRKTPMVDGVLNVMMVIASVAGAAMACWILCVSIATMRKRWYQQDNDSMHEGHGTGANHWQPVRGASIARTLYFGSKSQAPYQILSASEMESEQVLSLEAQDCSAVPSIDEVVDSLE